MMQRKTKIKICGLKRPEDIEMVNQWKPDFCGFVIEVKKSPRNVSEKWVRTWTPRLDPAIIPVGVFVNAPVELPGRLLKEGILGMAQLHGQEDEEYIWELRKWSSRPLIQAFSIKSAEDMQKAGASTADYILLDQGSGGTGKTFDWTLIGSVERPFFLAGGLGPDNLAAAIDQVHPWAVDLSSGLETDGCKDPQKVQQIMKAISV